MIDWLVGNFFFASKKKEKRRNDFVNRMHNKQLGRLIGETTTTTTRTTTATIPIIIQQNYVVSLYCHPPLPPSAIDDYSSGSRSSSKPICKSVSIWIWWQQNWAIDPSVGVTVFVDTRLATNHREKIADTAPPPQYVNGKHNKRSINSVASVGFFLLFRFLLENKATTTKNNKRVAASATVANRESEWRKNTNTTHKLNQIKRFKENALWSL